MGKKHLGGALVKALREDIAKEDWLEYPYTKDYKGPCGSKVDLVPMRRLLPGLNAEERASRESKRPEESPYVTGWDRRRETGRSAYSPCGDQFYQFALEFFRYYDKLEILAFGDFSYNGRYAKRNIIYARDPACEAAVKFRVIDTG